MDRRPGGGHGKPSEGSLRPVIAEIIREGLYPKHSSFGLNADDNKTIRQSTRIEVINGDHRVHSLSLKLYQLCKNPGPIPKRAPI